jgi:hypothetical protein
MVIVRNTLPCDRKERAQSRNRLRQIVGARLRFHGGIGVAHWPETDEQEFATLHLIFNRQAIRRKAAPGRPTIDSCRTLLWAG